MADNVPITPGTGKIIATDEVIDGTLGTVQVQFVKIMDGTLDGTSKAAVGVNGLKVDGSAITQPISAASLPLPTDAATETTLALINAKTDNLDVALSTRATETTLLAAKVDLDKFTFVATRVLTDGSGVTQPISASSLPLPTGAATETTLGTRLADSTFTGRINTLGQKIMADSTPIAIASDQSTVPVTISTVATSVVTRVASSASTQQLLASNINRKMAVFYNDSTDIQYLKFGITASTVDFTIKMTPQSYYELPSPVYNGRIDCLSANTNGGIQITELT